MCPDPRGDLLRQAETLLTFAWQESRDRLSSEARTLRQDRKSLFAEKVLQLRELNLPFSVVHSTTSAEFPATCLFHGFSSGFSGLG